MQMRLIWISHCDTTVGIIMESFVGWISPDYIHMRKTYKPANVFSCQNKVKGRKIIKLRNAWPCWKAWERRLWKACLKDMQWQEHRSPYCTSSWAPCLHQNLPDSPSSPPVFHSVFPYITLTSLHGHSKIRCTLWEYVSPDVTLHLSQHYLQLPSDTQTQSLACALVESAEAQTQPLAPWAESGFTHSISSASIMTVW